MNLITLILICTIIWFILGVVSAWRLYWGEVKSSYLTEGIDKRLSLKQICSKEKIYKVYLILIFWGLLSFIAIEIFMETTWYFKIPKKEELLTFVPPTPKDYGKMFN